MTAPGVLIAGRYRLVDRVGVGGMGSVWGAWDELLQRRVAIKQLLPQPGLSADEAATARDRVIREARITARLHHPNAVTLYDVVEQDGRPCLIMQFVPSVTLSALVRVEGPIQPQFAARIGAELASALGAAHRVGIIHRDVKPGNVLITDDSSAKLTDFGISHAVGDVNLTSTGMVTGTPAFLAPEVARGAKSGFPADVFSLGGTLYAAVEGGPPFGSDVNPLAILHRVASGQLITPERTGRLTPLILRMLAHDPADRPAMTEVADALAQLNEDFAGNRPGSPQQQTVEAKPAVGDAPTEGAAPADPATAALAVLPELHDDRPTTTTLHEPTERRRRIGVLPLAIIAAVLTALIVAGVLIVANRDADNLAGPPALSSSPTNTSGGRTSAPKPSATSKLSASKKSATSNKSEVKAAPRVTAPRPTTARSTPSSASRSASSASAPSSAPTSAPSSVASSAPTSAPSSVARSTGSASSGSATSSVRPSSTAPASSAGTPSATELASAISDYYALLPANTDRAWERLTTRFQTTTAVDRQYYQRFWDSVKRTTIRGAEGSTPDAAGAEITYYFKDGRVAVEATLFTLERDGDRLEIDTSTVLSSEVR